jgi:hypothetical protein
MTNVPQVPHSGNPTPSPSGDPGPWIDLVAFLGVLALGGVLIALGHIAVISLATICAALGGLYTVWSHLR